MFIDAYILICVVLSCITLDFVNVGLDVGADVDTNMDVGVDVVVAGAGADVTSW